MDAQLPRIVHIIPTLDRAGAEKQLVILAKGLHARGYPVHVVVLTRDGPLHEELDRAGVPTTIIGKKWKIDPGAYRRLCRTLREVKPDIVQTWIFAANAYGRLAARRCGVPVVIGGERCIDLWKGWPQWAIDRFLAKRSDKIVANSTGVKAYCAAHGIPAEKITVIPNGIEPITLPQVSREAILLELDLPDDAQLVGVVGRLWPQKRVKDAIWAVDLLIRVCPRVHLLVLGDGPLYDNLVRFRDNLGLEDRVHFLGHRNDALRIMRRLDVLWSTSGYEGLSNTVMEAMALGVPVVATDIPGNRDLVVPGETGYLVPVGEKGRAEFIRHTRNLLNDPDTARRLGENARRRVVEHFSAEAMIDRYCELYRALLEPRTAQSNAVSMAVG